jgi:hypothetical protein
MTPLSPERLEALIDPRVTELRGAPAQTRG